MKKIVSISSTLDVDECVQMSMDAAWNITLELLYVTAKIDSHNFIRYTKNPHIKMLNVRLCSHCTG